MALTSNNTEGGNENENDDSTEEHIFPPYKNYKENAYKSTDVSHAAKRSYQFGENH